jgi:PP-loop superfamily ATP-utilizing enzyme
MKDPNKNSWEKLDAHWKEKLQEKSDAPNLHIWEQLENRLDEHSLEKRKKNKIVFLKFASWAAFLAIALGFIWVKLQTSPTQTISQAVPKIIQKEKIIVEKKSLQKEAYQITDRIKALVKNDVASPNQIKKRIKEVIIPKAIEKQEEMVIVGTDMSVLKEPKLQAPEKQEEQAEIWVKVAIDPIQNTQKADQTLLTEEKALPIKKKKSLGQMIRQLKNLMDGEAVNDNNPNTIQEGIHQVANKYYQTEEKFKQTFQ